MSFGTRRGWVPRAFPADRTAARRLQEWLQEGGGSLDAVGLDLRGADLTGGDFSESWFSDAKLTGVVLKEADFYRADMQGLTSQGLIWLALPLCVLTLMIP